MAGAIAEARAQRCASDFRTIDPADARVVLVEAGPRVLPAFPSGSRSEAKRALEKLGVEVQLDAPVTAMRRGRRASWAKSAIAARDRHLGGGRLPPRRPRAGSGAEPTARAGSRSAPI